MNELGPDPEPEKKDGDEATKEPKYDEKLNDKYKCSKPGYYALQSFITHLGDSMTEGHYVCHIRKNIENYLEKQWVYYNDHKVTLEGDYPPIGKGYMYFFNKVDEPESSKAGNRYKKRAKFARKDDDSDSFD